MNPTMSPEVKAASGTHAYQPRLLALFCVVLLSVTLVRLSLLTVNEIRRYDEVQQRDALIPTFGSLEGIDASGAVRKLESDSFAHSLLFVIRLDHIASDIQFWNDVIRRVGSSPIAMRYWGICDTGVACGSYQHGATFPILGHLDPYQMRVVARTHDMEEVLMYDPANTLKARIRRVSDPALMSSAIRQGAQ